MSVYLSDRDLTILNGDALPVLTEMGDATVAGVVTSPPYLNARPEYPAIRDYYGIFSELARVCRGGMLWTVGRLWKHGQELLWWRDLIDAARAVGWEHWDTALWIKPNPNPIQGRLFSNSHEYILAFGREGVVFDEDAIRVAYQPGSIERLRRRWISSISVKGDTSERSGARRAERRVERHEPHEVGARAPGYFIASVGKEKGNPHPAPMPLELALPLVALVAKEGEIVLDPFFGSGTTGLAARRLRRRCIGIELDEDYCALATSRLAQQSIFTEATV